MSKARDSIEDLKTIDANLAAKASNTALAAKAPLASPSFTGTGSVNGKLAFFDGNTQTRNGGVATEANAALINFGLNEGSGNRFGGSYNQASQGGMLNFDTRANQPLFQIYGRAAGVAEATGTALLSITSDGRGLSEYTAKAWVNLNGIGTIAIRDSHNISSITDNGTGDYICVFAVAMSNANYAAVANGGAVNNWRGTETTVITVSTANFRIYHVEDSSTYDTSFITGIVFGA